MGDASSEKSCPACKGLQRLAFCEKLQASGFQDEHSRTSIHLDPLPNSDITQQFTHSAIQKWKAHFALISKAHEQHELLAQATATTAAPVIASASAQLSLLQTLAGTTCLMMMISSKLDKMPRGRECVHHVHVQGRNV